MPAAEGHIKMLIAMAALSNVASTNPIFQVVVRAMRSHFDKGFAPSKKGANHDAQDDRRRSCPMKGHRPAA